jgi:hypothetical protein
MKKLFIIVSFVSWLINVSCNNSNDSKKNSNTTNRNTEASQTTPGAGTGTITCIMDAKQRTFNVQGFREITLDPYSKGPTDGILFADGNPKKEGFQFEIKKNGTTKIKGALASDNDKDCIINYYNPQGIVYTGKDVVVNVASFNQSQLTGTFSGKLVNVYYDGGSKDAKNYPEFIQITDGKFDVQK